MITKRSFWCRLFLLAACVLAAFLSTTAWAQGVSQQQVDLSSAFNVSGIYTDGTTISGPGFDTTGCGYSSVAMAETAPGPAGGMNPSGTTSYPTLSLPQSSNTITFNFGPANQPNAVTGCTPVGTASCSVSTAAGTISLPAGEFTELELIGTGVEGGQTGTVTVGYTDGSSDNFIQGFSDWYSTGPYNIGESIALLMPYRLCGSSIDNRPFRVYNYEIAINATKTVQSMTLPNNRDILVLAATVVAIPGFATAGGAPSSPTVSPGSTVTVPVTVSSEAGYGGTVTLNATVSPNITTPGGKPLGWSFSPSSVSVGVGAPGTSTLTLSPAAPSSAAIIKPHSTWFYAFWLPIPGLAVVGLGSGNSRRRKLCGLLLLAMVLAGIVITPACLSTVHVGNVGTPPGQYTIAITGVDTNGLTQLGAGGSVTIIVK